MLGAYTIFFQRYLEKCWKNSFHGFISFANFVNFQKSMKSHFPAFLWISLKKNLLLAPSIPHFKGLGMANLQYEIKVCQKIHNKVTMAMSSYFAICQLCQFPEIHEKLFSSVQYLWKGLLYKYLVYLILKVLAWQICNMK